MEQIKVGDKVRVRKDAPSDYIKTETIPTAREFTVTAVGRTHAEIKLDGALLPAYYCVPLKYLKAKEPKFKVGDVVRIKPNAADYHQGYQNGYAWLPNRDDYLGRVAFVKEIWRDGSLVLNIAGNMTWKPIDLEPYTEPTEDEIIRQREAEFDEFAKEELDGAHHPEKYTTYEVTVDNVAINWLRYTADLAKELALKVANKFNDPEVAAEYAVKVAKAVVEGLKGK